MKTEQGSIQPTRTLNPVDAQRHFRQMGYLAVSLGSLLYGGNVVVARILASQFPPLALASLRSILGLLVLIPFAWRLGRKARPRRSDIPYLAFLGLLGVSFAYGTFAWSMRSSMAVNAAIIFATFPAVTIAVLAVFWHVKPLPSQLLGMGIAFAGLVLVAVQGSWQRLLTLTFQPSDIILFANVIAFTFFNILGQRFMERYSPLVTGTYCLFFGSLWLLPFGIKEILTLGWTLSWEGWLLLLYMGMIVSGLGLLLNLEAVSRIGSSAVSMINNLTPVFAVGLAALLLREPLYLYHWAGFTLVLGGVGLSLFPTWPFNKNDRHLT